MPLKQITYVSVLTCANANAQAHSRVSTICALPQEVKSVIGCHFEVSEFEEDVASGVVWRDVIKRRIPDAIQSGLAGSLEYRNAAVDVAVGLFDTNRILSPFESAELDSSFVCVLEVRQPNEGMQTPISGVLFDNGKKSYEVETKNGIRIWTCTLSENNIGGIETSSETVYVFASNDSLLAWSNSRAIIDSIVQTDALKNMKKIDPQNQTGRMLAGDPLFWGILRDDGDLLGEKFEGEIFGLFFRDNSYEFKVVDLQLIKSFELPGVNEQAIMFKGKGGQTLISRECTIVFDDRMDRIKWLDEELNSFIARYGWGIFI